ncbi:hypothetical protein O2W14_11280 [Modestobacter sp. VKM Ac-2986]|uniref:hypothetical protein n=1 Tax=Modestobacter sp. VKM Ac-2986 TaxID=3004140 RepID=UPI0022ABC248|nr:hypothetical protein [Modestobacter sp. VKM Ac-2986]MCZ2829416.1 hypothetical protein [Modestobacter sp. VKM Ac-2986]
MSGPLSSSPAAGAFSRRSLLLGTLAGAAVLATGCTGDPVEDADAVTPAQVDQLAAQVQVQETLVAAYASALTAAPELATTAAGLADQARAQLDRLRAAAPGAGATSSAPPAPGTPAATATDGPPDAAGAREWLRTRVTAAADAHAAACPAFTGGRAALLGSVSAGLRGQAGQLA